MKWCSKQPLPGQCKSPFSTPQFTDPREKFSSSQKFTYLTLPLGPYPTETMSVTGGEITFGGLSAPPSHLNITFAFGVEEVSGPYSSLSSLESFHCLSLAEVFTANPLYDGS